jgi:hypothetical protein
MTIDPKEIIEAVDDLNMTIQKHLPNLNAFTFSTDGTNQWVEFLGQPIWDDETDERGAAHDEGDEYPEPIIDYLRREAGKFLSNLFPVKL